MANMNFLYENITNKICKMLEEGTVPWKKSWSAKNAPQNLITKIPYRGINVWTLISSPNASTPFWATWKQIMNLKGRVKTDEAKNYEIVVFWKQLKYTKNVNGVEEENTFPMLRYSRVYNLGQCEFDQKTLDKLVSKTEENPFTPIEMCEQIINGYKDCPPINSGGDRAYYSPSFDKIQMPNKDDFNTPENYYSVLFHEMAHSTGAEKRLNRFKANESNIFGSDSYSKEELIAEMTSSFLCAEANIENNILNNSASYINNWLKAIKNSDKTFVMTAASKASMASDYILNKIYIEKNED